MDQSPNIDRQELFGGLCEPVTRKQHGSSWWSRVADEYGEQKSLAAKAWWTTRFVLGVLTVGNCDFGIAALGSDDTKFDRAVRKASARTQEEARRRGRNGDGDVTR
jgi:hypothetical protein